jgi:HAD superfamily hydrolase (TIGR01509 family)
MEQGMDHLTHIKAFIFDMDGLMLDTERIAERAWTMAMAERGYLYTSEINLKVIGRTLVDTKLIFGEVFGAGLPFDEIYQRKLRYSNHIISQEGIPIKPGLVDLLAELKIRGYQVAVGSSTERETLIKKLSLVGLIDQFGVIVCGDEVESGKPAPDIFLEAARRLGVSPQACVVLEDSENGIKAAHAAGMVPIMVPDLKPPTEEMEGMAYRILNSLAEVIDLIAV